MVNIQIKQVYYNKTADGTYRILVDRLWPRGIHKDDLQIDEWNKELAPSVWSRKWFGHNPRRFEEFKIRYSLELSQKENELNRIRKIANTNKITLLYGAKSSSINHAIILQGILMKKTL